VKATTGPGKSFSLLLTSNETAAFFEVSLKTLAKWTKNGCPKESRGKYDLKKVHAWWLAHLYDGKMEVEDEGMNAARRKYWWAKARREEIKEKLDSGALMKKEDVYPGWRARVVEVSNGLGALSFRLVGLISPFLRDQSDKIAIQEIIDNEQWKMRDNFARAGKFCPPE